MNDLSDARLLRDYAEHGSEAAFREIVARHTDLVYSAAARQVFSADAAGDVAQVVFSDLARKAPALAGALDPNASLVGWLYRSTRLAASNQLRADRRRLARERLAMENADAAPPEAPEWDQVRPVLDDAMSELSDPDREALLLRFFKHHDFRTIGHLLGLSDDAAQKRVSRALDKLRVRLSGRGVTSTVGALSAALLANSVSAAPAGLAATLSTTALAGANAAAATVTAIKALTMTTLQKVVITTTVIAALGTGVYQARQASQLREQVQTLQRQQAPLGEQLQQLQRERDEALSRAASLGAENEKVASGQNAPELVKLRGEVVRLRQQLAQPAPTPSAASDPFTQHIEEVSTRARELNQHLQRMPERAIPELQFLSGTDWLEAAQNANLDTEVNIRKALRKLRDIAKNKMPMGQALAQYTRANNGQLPTDLSQLKPYFKTPVGSSDANWGGVDPERDSALLDTILARYTLLRTGNVNDLPPEAWIVAEKAPVDREYDSRAKFGIGHSSVISTGAGESGDPEDKGY